MSNHICGDGDAFDPSCADCIAHDETCGIRCDRCSERMCAFYGPEPRACGVTCTDCPCDCTACLQQRQEMRADLIDRLEREARA